MGHSTSGDIRNNWTSTRIPCENRQMGKCFETNESKDRNGPFVDSSALQFLFSLLFVLS
jgi:hypothetical protein